MRTRLALILCLVISVQAQVRHLKHHVGGGRVINSAEFNIPGDIFVSPTGNDSNTGLDAGHAFLTLDHARVVARSLANTNCSIRIAQNAPINIRLETGTFFLTSQFLLTGTGGSNDNGCSAGVPIIYSPDGGATPVISGGIRVTGWVNTTGNTWVASFTGSYFETLYFDGERRFRPRLGATAAGNPIGQYFRIASADTSCSGGLCYDRFFYNPADPIIGTWTNFNSAPDVVAACSGGQSNSYPNGDIELVNFNKWNGDRMRISGINTTTHEICLSGSTLVNPQNNGYVANNRYVIENVKNELTQPGQFFLDRAANTITYLTKTGENPNTSIVIVPQVTAPVVKGNGLQFVTFKGITFSHDNYAVAATGYPGQQVDFPLQTALFYCINCGNVSFDGNTISHTMTHGVWFATNGTSTTTASNAIINNAAFDLGAGGFYVGRQPQQTSDTDTNVFRGNVSNNRITGVGRFFPASAGIAQFLTNTTADTHNEVSDTYATGIEHCVPSGANCKGGVSSTGTFNVTSTFNLVFKIGQGVTADLGGIYMATYDATGVFVSNNRIHDVSGPSKVDTTGAVGGNGIYLDNQTCGVTVNNNLVYRAEWALIWMSRGPQVTGCPNILDNNILAYPNQSVVRGPSAPPTPLQQFQFKHNLVLMARDYTATPIPLHVIFGCGPFGSPLTNIQDFNNNMYWNTHATFSNTSYLEAFQTNASDCSAKFNRTWSSWVVGGEDTGSVATTDLTTKFNNATYPTDDYTLPGGAPGVSFSVFDTTAPGLSNAGLVPTISPVPVPAFPTNAYLPADYVQ